MKEGLEIMAWYKIVDIFQKCSRAQDATSQEGDLRKIFTTNEN